MNSKNKKASKKRQPIPFGDIDVVRKSIEWYMVEASKLHKQLEPHKTKRAFIGATNEEGDYVCLMFKGSVEDIFLVKSHLEELDEKPR